MAVIGIRCFPEGFSFVVLKGTQENPEVVSFDRYNFPKDMEWGAKLNWLKTQIEEILRQHNINEVAMKRIEPSAQKKPLNRLEVEGVVKETVFSLLGCECKAKLNSQIKRDINGFTQRARYLERVLESRGLNELNNPNYKDATLVAISELPT